MTLGSDAAVRGYLSAMWREMSEKRYSPDCLRHDQAFHNWLLWSGALGAGVRACSAERGPVSTIGWPEHLYRDRYGRVLNRAGEVAHVVHQFDRRKQLVDSLGARCTAPRHALPRRAPHRPPRRATAPPAAPPRRAPPPAPAPAPPRRARARCRGRRYALINKPEPPPRTPAPIDTSAVLDAVLRGDRAAAAAMSAAAALPIAEMGRPRSAGDRVEMRRRSAVAAPAARRYKLPYHMPYHTPQREEELLRDASPRFPERPEERPRD